MPKDKIKKITKKPTKSPIKKKTKSKNLTSRKIKAKPGDSHVKSFYRPRTVHINVVKNEDKIDTKVEQMIWVPVALALAITSIGLNMMLVIYHNYR